MAIHSINHVPLAFPAGAEGPVRNFYAQLLGLTELRHAATGPALHFAAGPQRIERVPTERWAPAPRLLQAELPLVEHRALPGYLRFYVKDPARNWLEFLQPDTEQELPV